MASSNNFDWSQYQIENPKEQQEATQAESADQSTSDFDWSQYEVEKPMTGLEKAAEIAFESAKGVARLPLNALGTILPKLTQMAGGGLQALSGIGVEGEPGQVKGAGTRSIRTAGEYLSKVGEEEESKYLATVEDLLGPAYGKGEEALTGFASRAAFGTALGIPAIDAIIGGGSGEVAKLMGFSEEVQGYFEMGGMSLRSLYKGMMNLFKSGKTPEAIIKTLKTNPKASGEITGLAGTQLEAFNALSDAEKASFIQKILEKETSILGKAAAEGQAAATAQEAAARENALGPGFESIQKGKQPPGRSLQGRVSVGGEDIGVRPATVGIRPTTTEANLENMLGRVHANELGNKTDAGIALKNTVMASDNAAYQHVNDLYTRSRELNAGINESHQQLVHQLQDRFERLDRIPRPSSVQTNLMNALEDIIDELVIIEDGQIFGYREVNNQVLIDQIQSLRQIVDFDFEHGSPKGIFRPTIADIQESVYTAARGEGADALQEANTAYREWTDQYNNDTINPYRDRSNQNYEQLIDKNLKSDQFNVVNNLVGDTPVGNEILGATRREIVEKKLKKFVEKPYLVRTRGFRRAMTDLESVLSPEQLNSVRTEMESQVPQRTRVEAKVKEKVIPEKFKPRDVEAEIKVATREIKAAAKYSNKTPAEIRRLSTTPEGIAQLKSDLSKTKGGKDLFNKLAEKKINSIATGGKTNIKPTGKELAARLGEEGNRAIFEAFTSPEDVEVALKAAQELADKKFTWENVKGVVKGVGKFKLLHWIIG